jgi:hypothetical protein
VARGSSGWAADDDDAKDSGASPSVACGGGGISDVPPPKPGGDDGRSVPPPEIQVRSRQHLSLFNLLDGEDMEVVYAAMSRMLRAPESSSSSSSGDSFVRSELTRSVAEESSCGNDASNGDGGGSDDPEGKGGADNASGRSSGDHWTGRVKRTRRKDHVVSAGDGIRVFRSPTFWLLVLFR